MSNEQKQPKEKDLRVWWMPVVPGSRVFNQPVPDVKSALLVIRTLAAYDNDMVDRGLLPDAANACGLEVYERGEWCEWMDENCREISELARSDKDPDVPESAGEFVDCDQEVFLHFLASYPAPLDRDVVRFVDPPRIQFNDFRFGNWPQSVVADYSTDPDSGVREFRIKPDSNPKFARKGGKSGVK